MDSLALLELFSLITGFLGVAWAARALARGF
jgi:hypothetical protein